MFVMVAGGYTYVTDLPVKKNSVVVADFGHSPTYLLVESVGLTRVDIGCTYDGPLKQIMRIVPATGKERAAIKRVFKARKDLEAAEAEYGEAKRALEERSVDQGPRMRVYLNR